MKRSLGGDTCASIKRVCVCVCDSRVYKVHMIYLYTIKHRLVVSVRMVSRSVDNDRVPNPFRIFRISSSSSSSSSCPPSSSSSFSFCFVSLPATDWIVLI